MLEYNSRLTHLSLKNIQLEHSTIDCIASKSLVYLRIDGECCHAAETCLF